MTTPTKKPNRRRQRWIQVRVDDREHAEIARRAEAADMSMSELIRQLALVGGDYTTASTVQETDHE